VSLERLEVALAERYRIERELGQGGMATVWLAQDLKHDRKVAIKVLKPELAAVLGAERFVQEIKTTAALSHPHILPLFDSGEAAGFLYYVMPYLQGETIREKLSRERQLGITEAVEITTEVADALDYAHRHGVIHRDIKPENILLHDGRPMVMDFGIALAVSAAAGGRMTETGLSLGTPHYMSPEQATADREITGRSDIYSLASVLYEMLTGEPPHMGTSAQQIIMKIIAEPIAPVTTLRKNVPPHVAAAVAMALEKLPADRFATAGEFARALANPHFTATTTAATLTPNRNGFRWSHAALGLLVGAVLTAAAARLVPRATHTAALVERHQLSFEGLAIRPGLSPDGTRLAYVRESCERANYETSAAAPVSGARCQASLLVQDVGGTQSTVILSKAAHIGRPRWTADGGTIVVSARLDDARSGLFTIPLLTGTPTLIGPEGLADTHPSADSVVLVTTVSRNASAALIIDLRSGKESDRFAVPFEGVQSISWSPDGSRFVVKTLSRLNILDRRGNLSGSIALSNRPQVRWHPDGQSVLGFEVGTGREDELVRFRVARDGSFEPGREVMLARVQTLLEGDFDIARRTGTLALVTGELTMDLHSLDLTASPPSSRRLTYGTTFAGGPSATPDGKGVYFLQGDAAGDNVYYMDLTTGEREALTSQRRASGYPRLSSDGRRLVFTHHADSTQEVREMALPSRRVRGISGPSVVEDQVAPVGASGLLGIMSRTGELVLADSLGGAWRPVSLPDSIFVGWAYLAASEDSGAIVSAWTASGQLQLILVPFSGHTHRVLATLPAGETELGLSLWADTAYVARWLADDPSPSLWQLPLSTGAFKRHALLPVRCAPWSVSVAKGGRMAACNVGEIRRDIWIYRVPGIAR
jgi:serine/threonine protein kinase/Tol biopolymer transport system component